MALPEQPDDIGEKSAVVQFFSRPLVICLLLATVTFAVYWPVKNYDFIDYDDPLYFSANPHVLRGVTGDDVLWAFTNGETGNWHPLTWLSLMLDAEWFGKGSAGPHLTNLLIHVANVILLFLLLRKMTATLWRSAVVAALFALHPLHVESVAWIAERKDVLSASFGLLSLWCYAKFVAASKAGSPKSKRFYGLTLMFFTCGLMSKPMLVTLPFVMLLLDFWPLKRVAADETSAVTPSMLLRRLPALFVVTFLVQHESGAVIKLGQFSVSERIVNAFVSYVRYLGKTIWPVSMANPYSHPRQLELPIVIFSMALVVCFSIAAIRIARKFPAAFTGWFWFVGMLVPVIGLVQVGNQSMADRYTYLPLVGVFIVIVWGFCAVCVNSHMPKPFIVLLTMTVLIACAWRTRDQLRYWQNSGTLFSHTLAVTKDNYAAYINLGTWLSSQGRVAEAIDCFNQSLQIIPDNESFYYMGSALYNLGNALAKTGKWDEAIDNYRRALKFTPNQADILNNLGFALAAKKQFDEAISCFEKALQLNPDSSDAHNNLATILFIEHRFDEAAQHYREAIRLAPDNAQIYSNLGDTLVKEGQLAEAVQNYQTALRLNPGDARTGAKLQALGAQISN
jgi:Flp pilus assembly protein TadD